jgi:hypothetical protein
MAVAPCMNHDFKKAVTAAVVLGLRRPQGCLKKRQ